LGRKQFQRCVSIVRRQDRGEAWRTIRYLVFDAPAIAATFEERQAQCEAWFSQAKPPYAAFHPHQRCQDIAHMRAELERVEALGGEGVMLRQPGSRYVAGRSTTLLKVKSFRDAEARVLGHTHGAGRHAGRVGALEVELPDGTRFSVGTGLSDAERDTPPPVGSIITFRYQELSDDGVPRFPSYVGIREDADWQPEPKRSKPKRA
jgi:DNA ligase-1